MTYSRVDLKIVPYTFLYMTVRLAEACTVITNLYMFIYLVEYCAEPQMGVLVLKITN